MITAIIQGVLLGLTLSILVGPIFFAILQLVIERGPKSATLLAAGQWLGDIIYIVLVFWGGTFIEQLLEDPIAKNQFIVYAGSLGALILTAMGIELWVGKPPDLHKQQTLGNKIVGAVTAEASWRLYIQFFMKGFLINVANPAPLFFWATLMTTSISDNYTATETYILYISVMGVVVISDLLKIYAAKYIRSWLKKRHLIYVRRIAGTVLIAFSIFLVIQVLRILW